MIRIFTIFLFLILGYRMPRMVVIFCPEVFILYCKKVLIFVKISVDSCWRHFRDGVLFSTQRILFSLLKLFAERMIFFWPLMKCRQVLQEPGDVLVLKIT